MRGFWKGLSASYAGISETVVQFVVYERIKKMVEEHNLAVQGAKVAADKSSSEGT